MILKELTLNNFLSHENTKINFLDTEKLLLEGKSGSGKSSITEAILWVLYGKSRTDNRSLIRSGEKSATVSLKLGLGSEAYVITRSVSDKGKNTLIVTKNTGAEGQFLPIGTTGLKDTQAWIEKDLLKASYELFTNSIAYPQESENSFVKANASKRKDLLLEIVRAGNFDELYEKARKFISNLELENAVTLSKISSLEEAIKRNKVIASSLDSYSKIYDEASGQIKTLEIVEKDLESQLHDISNATSQIANNKRMIKVLNDSIIAIDIQIDFNNKDIEEHSKIDPLVFKKDIEESEKLSKEAEIIETELKNSAESSNVMYNHMANRPQVFDYSRDIEEINKRLIPLIKDSSKCPAGDACPFIAPIQGQITYLTEQITEKEGKSKSEKEALEKWEAVKATIPPIKDTTELYKRLKEINERINVLSKSKDLAVRYLTFKDNLGELNTKQISLKIERDDKAKEIIYNESIIKNFEELLKQFDINKVNGDLSNIRLSKQELQKKRDDASVNKQMAINAQAAVKIDSTELASQNSLILKGSESIACTSLLKEALSPRGIKAVVIDYLVPQLEDRINVVLGQMSDFKIRLDTQAQTADEEGIKEGLFITVINDRKEELSFANYSGGEKVKITIAIAEALASLMNQVGFRIMDENIVSLDRESTEGFVEVLTRLQEKFPQLLVISHLQEVKDMFEKQITIIKTNGISKII